MKVSFDFDETLSFKSVQEYAKELIEKGIEVHIVTSRYENRDDYDFVWENGHNDLFKVADNLGIPRENIHFTNMEDKFHFFLDKDFIWHLDDNNVELLCININTKTKGIDRVKSNWKQKCEELISK